MDEVRVTVEPDMAVAITLADAPTLSALAGMQGPPGPPGPQGPKGEPGLSGASFVHIQDVPAAVWTIAHGLSRYPHATCVDSAGNVVWGDAEYPSDSLVVLRFAAPFAGRAYLN